MANKAFEKYIDQEVLINCVEIRPVVWDKTLEIYKDKIAKAAAWREICVILKEDFEAMEQKERQDFGKYLFYIVMERNIPVCTSKASHRQRKS
jgi:hypothetical protein